MHGTSRVAGRGATGKVLCAVLVAVLVLLSGAGAYGVHAAEGRGAAGAVPGAASDGIEQTAAGADVEVRAPGRRTTPASPRTVRPARPAPGAVVPQAPIGRVAPPEPPDVRPLRCVVMRC